MSDWKCVGRDDLELSSDKDTVEVFVDEDGFGANYLEIKVSDLLDIIKGEDIGEGDEYIEGSDNYGQAPNN